MRPEGDRAADTRPEPDVAPGMTLRWSRCHPPAGMRAPQASTPDGTVVYAIGDIHGRFDLLAALHQGIALDARRRPARQRLVVYLGDYISRGLDSRRVIDRILRWRPEGFEIAPLKGNHEDLLLRFLDDDLASGAQWLDHGGVEGLAHYGVHLQDPTARDDATLADARQRLRAALPAGHHAFLRGLATSRREGGYLFAHAGVLPGTDPGAQPDSILMWIRGRFLDSDDDHGAVVVHGHCIFDAPQVRHNRISIDTGAFRSGVLTCLVLDGAGRAFLQTRPAPPDSPTGPPEAGATGTVPDSDNATAKHPSTEEET